MFGEAGEPGKADHLKLRPKECPRNSEISRSKGIKDIKKEEIPGEGFLDDTSQSMLKL